MAKIWLLCHDKKYQNILIIYECIKLIFSKNYKIDLLVGFMRSFLHPIYFLLEEFTKVNFVVKCVTYSKIILHQPVYTLRTGYENQTSEINSCGNRSCKFIYWLYQKIDRVISFRCKKMKFSFSYRTINAKVNQYIYTDIMGVLNAINIYFFKFCIIY